VQKACKRDKYYAESVSLSRNPRKIISRYELREAILDTWGSHHELSPRSHLNYSRDLCEPRYAKLYVRFVCELGTRSHPSSRSSQLKVREAILHEMSILSLLPTCWVACVCLSPKARGNEWDCVCRPIVCLPVIDVCRDSMCVSAAHQSTSLSLLVIDVCRDSMCVSAAHQSTCKHTGTTCVCLSPNHVAYIPVVC
jgi:hypothetical protein